jgi:hypothetical protein
LKKSKGEQIKYSEWEGEAILSAFVKQGGLKVRNDRNILNRTLLLKERMDEKKEE